MRAAVFDGARDPNADNFEATVQQLEGFETTLTTFLAECSADTDCAFHNDGDAEGAFDAADARARRNADPGRSGPPGRHPADRAAGRSSKRCTPRLYWPALEESLAEAQDGDGGACSRSPTRYFQRQPDGTFGNELEAFQAIGAPTPIERLTVEEDDAAAAAYTAVAPRLAPAGSVGQLLRARSSRTSIDPRVEITGAGAGPIVVVGTTGDPATPLDSTRAMAEALDDGRLVVVEADQHTGYNVNTCINEVVNEYLIDLVPPTDGTECR